MSPIHRVVLVDDEEPARRLLRRTLDGHDGFRVVGEATNGTQAVEVIQQTQIGRAHV